MKPPPRTLLLLSLAALACASCGKDPELVAKRERQQTEIARLRGEVALMEEKLKHAPPDVSAELTKEKDQAEMLTAEIARLEAEISDLQQRKHAVQAEFDSYRAKYQVK